MVNPFSQTAPYSGTGWIFTGTPGNITYSTLSPHNSRVSLIASATGLNDTGVQDLTDPTRLNAPISDTDWRLRLVLNWPTTNAFRNTGALFDGGDIVDIGLTDLDQNSNIRTDPQKMLGIRIINFDGNSPTPLIRAGGPLGFRALAGALGRDGATTFGSPTFTPGGQPQSVSQTPIEIIRAGSTLTANLYAINDVLFVGPIIETQVSTPIPAGVVGLKFLKVSNENFLDVSGVALISGFLQSYELLNGPPLPPTPPTFGTTTSLYSKLYGGT